MMRSRSWLRCWLPVLGFCAVVLIIYVPQMQQGLPDPDPGGIRVIDRHMFKQEANGPLNLLEPAFLNFQPDFDHPSTIPLIPRVIHQVWDTHHIPDRFHTWVSRWLEVNPGWMYWLWTLEDAKELIQRFYPEHLSLFENYPDVIHKVDAMRYFILHRYGGFYLDLDMEPLRSLDNWTLSYNCILSQETYEHTYVVRGEHAPNVVNGIMGCRSGHPLFALAIRSLPPYARKFFGDYLHATGPMFLNSVYLTFLNASSRSDVTVVPPKYFLPTYDPSESETLSSKCFPTRMRDLPVEGQTLCKTLLQQRFKNTPHKDSYTDHHWVHANMYDEAWKKRNTRSIFELLPGAQSPNIT